MPYCSGQIGLFWAGNKQIGGCHNWNIDFEIHEKHVSKNISDWRILAEHFWFYELHHPYFTASLCWVSKGELLLAQKVEVLMPQIECEAGKYYKQLLELRKYEP